MPSRQLRVKVQVRHVGRQILAVVGHPVQILPRRRRSRRSTVSSVRVRPDAGGLVKQAVAAVAVGTDPAGRRSAAHQRHGQDHRGGQTDQGFFHVAPPSMGFAQLLLFRSRSSSVSFPAAARASSPGHSVQLDKRGAAPRRTAVRRLLIARHGAHGHEAGHIHPAVKA